MTFQRILISSATELELAPLSRALGISSDEFQVWHRWKTLDLNVLITGPGIPQTSFTLGQRLALDPPDLVLHLGIAGTRPGLFDLGEVVHVGADRFGDIGVEEASGAFVDMFSLGLWEQTFPWEAGHLVSPNPLPFELHLPTAKGLTVNTIPGTAAHIEQMSGRYPFDIESMEGAAVVHSCRLARTPCLCIRGISNRIEPRNRAEWDIDLAVRNVCLSAERILEQLTSRVNRA